MGQQPKLGDQIPRPTVKDKFERKLKRKWAQAKQGQEQKKEGEKVDADGGKREGKAGRKPAEENQGLAN